MISVPDPDFHDFDMDRSEEVFKAKQIWAIYDPSLLFYLRSSFCETVSGLYQLPEF